MDDFDSIDGLGLTFDHLSTDGKLVAIFRKLNRQMSDEERNAIDEALTKAKGLSDDTQQRLRRIIAGQR